MGTTRVKVPQGHRKVIERVMADAGIEDWHLEPGGKHPRLIYTHRGEQRFYVLPGTVSDERRSAMNAESDLRRLLDCPKHSRPRKSARRSHRKRIDRPIPKPAPIAPVKPDPWEPLRQLRADMDRAPLKKPSIAQRLLRFLGIKV